MKTKRLTLALALLLSAACARENVPEGESGTVAVRFDLSGADNPDTRSIVGVAEDSIGSLLLLFYEGGSLRPDLCVSEKAAGSSSRSVTVNLDIGHDYEVVALANCRLDDYPPTISGALSLGYSCDGVGSWSSGIPMSAYGTVHARYAMAPVPLTLVRLASRLDLSVDVSGLRHGSITFKSFAVRQMNRYCPYFSQGSATSAGGVCDGDLASPSDLAAVNAGGAGYETTFYLLENIQGDILDGNTDPDRKVPESIVAAGADPGLCTYLEITGTYTDRSGALTSENVVAHLFLGSNAESNFDLVRNRRYNVSLAITDDGCLRTDWKIDGNLDDRRTLAFRSTSLSVGKGKAVTAGLETNLSLADGDYTYTVDGDTDDFTVTPVSGGFEVKSSESVAVGRRIVITATTWDGSMSTSCSINAYYMDTTRIYADWGDTLYVSQKGTLHISDVFGENLEGRVSVFTDHSCSQVEGSGSTWTVYAIHPGFDKLAVYVDNILVGNAPVEVVTPLLRFSSERIFLPMDGRSIDVGPYYYKLDGTRLLRSDCVPQLYDELLAFQVTRVHDGTVDGRRWRQGGPAGSPVISHTEPSSPTGMHSFNIDALSSRGYTIGENYDFSAGDAELEKIVASCTVANSRVLGANATLYTADPFRDWNFGGKDSWAPARWLRESSHDETFTLTGDNLVLAGNDVGYAGAEAEFGASRYSFSFSGRGALLMTALYGTYGMDAMPVSSFSMVPTMTNRVSGEVYRSCHRFSADFTVNLSVGGVAADAGAGRCSVSAEWGMPRSSALSSLEGIVASTAGGLVQGMYTPLYTVSGTPSSVKAAGVPAYRFCPAGETAAPSILISRSSYNVPVTYTPGYRFVVWKNEVIYPESNGWL